MAYFRGLSGGGGGEISGYTEVAREDTNRQSQTISNMNGKTLLVLIFRLASSVPYNNLANATCSGGTLTFISNLRPSSSGNSAAAGSFFKLVVTSDTCTISASNTFFLIAFEGNIE